MHNIDPRIEELFTRSFLQTEMSTHGVKNVVVNRLISTLGGRPTAFIAKERKILVDPEYPVGQMRQKLNEQSGCADLDLSDDECWAFCFWHECARADDASRSESQCNAYARQRILEYRKER